MAVTILSFGFKYGEPYPEADLRIDLRNRVANPQDHLPKGAVGTDQVVQNAVLGSDKNRKTLEQCLKRITHYLKSHGSVIVAFGCTSGIHRSVVFAEEVAARFRRTREDVELRHVHLKVRK